MIWLRGPWKSIEDQALSSFVTRKNNFSVLFLAVTPHHNTITPGINCLSFSLSCYIILHHWIEITIFRIYKLTQKKNADHTTYLSHQETILSCGEIQILWRNSVMARYSVMWRLWNLFKMIKQRWFLHSWFLKYFVFNIDKEVVKLDPRTV